VAAAEDAPADGQASRGRRPLEGRSQRAPVALGFRLLEARRGARLVARRLEDHLLSRGLHREYHRQLHYLRHRQGCRKPDKRRPQKLLSFLVARRLEDPLRKRSVPLNRKPLLVHDARRWKQSHREYRLFYLEWARTRCGLGAAANPAGCTVRGTAASDVLVGTSGVPPHELPDADGRTP
jgi:hypothetical protein